MRAEDQKPCLPQLEVKGTELSDMGMEDLNQGDLEPGDSQDVVGEGKGGIRWVRGRTVMPLT